MINGINLNDAKMDNKHVHTVLLTALLIMLPYLLHAQAWKFIKEKDGVQLYIRHDPGKGLRLFKGVAEIRQPSERVFEKLENINNIDWWTKDVSQLKVLLYEKEKTAQYYMVYRLPWPFKDRDLCVNVTATTNRTTGERRLTAVPLPEACITNHQCVRIKDYRQEWKVNPIDKNRSRVELEFYINPGANLPDWLVNMVLRDSPIRVINTLKESF